MRADEDGELLIRSETVFAGYYKDEEATREVLGEDGWLRSGDLGSIDADGFVSITDRKKDILVTAGGKNVAPQNLENALKTAPLVSQALVLGDRRPYVAALITVDPAVADGLPPDELERRVQAVVDGVNSDRSRLRTDQALPHPAARLQRRGRRSDADAEAQAPRRRGALRDRDRRALRGLEPASADVGRRVPAAERGDLDHVARVRRVDEAAAADVDPDVAEPVEEDDVARLQVAS